MSHSALVSNLIICIVEDVVALISDNVELSMKVLKCMLVILWECEEEVKANRTFNMRGFDRFELVCKKGKSWNTISTFD